MCSIVNVLIRINLWLISLIEHLYKNTITFTLRALLYQAFPGKGKFSIAQLWITVYIIYGNENVKSPVLRLLYIYSSYSQEQI